MTKIDVTDSDIRNGKQFTPNGCAIALAMQRHGYVASASQRQIRYRKWWNPVYKTITPSLEVARFITAFDLYGNHRHSHRNSLYERFFPSPKPISFEIP